GDMLARQRDAVLDVPGPGRVLADCGVERVAFEDAGQGLEAGDGLEHAATRRIARVRRARIAVVAGDRRVATGAGGRIADPRKVAHALRRADDGRRDAGSRRAGIGRARITVRRARGPVRLGRRLAAARGLVADAVVALIAERGAVARHAAAGAGTCDPATGTC